MVAKGRPAALAHPPRIDAMPYQQRDAIRRPIGQVEGVRSVGGCHDVGHVERQHRPRPREEAPFAGFEDQWLPQRRAPRIGGGDLHPVLAGRVGG